MILSRTVQQMIQMNVEYVLAIIILMKLLVSCPMVNVIAMVM
jgi:hypothetical protein